MNEIETAYDVQGQRIYAADCGTVLPTLMEPVDAMISDPPYHLRRQVRRSIRPTGMRSGSCG